MVRVTLMVMVMLISVGSAFAQKPSKKMLRLFDEAKNLYNQKEYEAAASVLCDCLVFDSTFIDARAPIRRYLNEKGMAVATSHSTMLVTSMLVVTLLRNLSVGLCLTAVLLRLLLLLSTHSTSATCSRRLRCCFFRV